MTRADKLQQDDVLTPAQILLEMGRGKSTAGRVRVVDEPAFVLTTYPWSESSLIAEVLTRSHGRVAVAIKGAKRAYSKFRGIINPFTPLMVTYAGADEVKNLTDAKWMGLAGALPAENLLSAFYVNELVLRMTMREDAVERLFDAYIEVIGQLTLKKGIHVQVALRRFEVVLLEALGWGQRAKDAFLEHPNVRWCVRDGELVPWNPSSPERCECLLTNACASAVIENNITTQSPLPEVREVLRRIIGYYVGSKGLNTRRTQTSWSEI